MYLIQASIVIDCNLHPDDKMKKSKKELQDNDWPPTVDFSRAIVLGNLASNPETKEHVTSQTSVRPCLRPLSDATTSRHSICGFSRGQLGVLNETSSTHRERANMQLLYHRLPSPTCRFPFPLSSFEFCKDSICFLLPEASKMISEYSLHGDQQWASPSIVDFRVWISSVRKE